MREMRPAQKCWQCLRSSAFSNLLTRSGHLLQNRFIERSSLVFTRNLTNPEHKYKLPMAY
ncbi:hypothetical protein BpHYR1_003805 [Brachionus plicatilis]|uniref:Uncharacterized protein n=1 Tax=Brachionus plicatilis TaxID=10195 RepID=A0A3M7RNL7_BRAPC|nr:hypothetical protein BpHYR1_003805 [Brachionus plicatilis]